MCFNTFRVSSDGIVSSAISFDTDLRNLASCFNCSNLSLTLETVSPF